MGVLEVCDFVAVFVVDIARQLAIGEELRLLQAFPVLPELMPASKPPSWGMVFAHHRTKIQNRFTSHPG